MNIVFKNAEVELLEGYNSDIILRCVRTVDGDGQQVEARTQTPTVVSMDNYQAYKLAMAILAKVDVTDTRGSR